MSYENVPKNLTEKAVLVRGGRPDYITLSTDPAPVPTVDEAGAIWEHSDTGDRFRWTSTVWIQVAERGSVNVTSRDFLFDVAEGNYPEYSLVTLFARNTNVGATNTETIWDQGGNYTYLTANTQLYVSSTDAGDTDVDLIIQGLDEDYNEVTATVNLNGQTQVAISSATMFRVHNMFTSPTSNNIPNGDVYLAESDTLTAGVPNTVSKIKSKINRARDTTGTVIDVGTDFASDNFTHNGFYTVPAGKTLIAIYAIIFVGKNNDITISGRVKLFGGNIWWNRSPSELYQNASVQEFQTRLPIPEKTDLEWRCIAGSAGAAVNFQLQLILKDNTI